MARKKPQSSSVGILLLALAASGALLGYLVLAPTDSETGPDAPAGAGNAGGALEFEFYDRLRQNEVQVNPPADEPVDAPEEAPPEPGPAEVEQLARQLNSEAQAQLETTAGALEQVAESIVAGLEAPSPDQAAAPEPVPSIALEPRPPVETVPTAPPQLSAPAPAETRRQTGTVLQSGAFRQRELAQSELERQRSLGLEVEMRQRHGQNGPLFLLQSGPYDSRDTLEETEMVFRLHNIPTARLPVP